MSNNSKKTNWLFETRINTRDMFDVLKMGKEIKSTVCILGPAGTGKTEITNQFAQKEYNGNICTLILSHYSVTDLVGQGVPTLVGDDVVMRHSRPTLIPLDQKWEGILFLDEVTNIVDTDMQHLLYQITHEHKVGNYALPPKMQVVLAGNRIHDAGESTEILGPLANRLIICELEPLTQHWLEDYASLVNIHPAIYEYVYDFPDELYEYGSKTDCPSFASGRSMKKASDICYAFQAGHISQKIMEVGINGVIGDNKFLKVWPKYESSIKLPRADVILEGRFNGKIDVKTVGLAGIYSVLNSCLYHLRQTLSVDKDKAVKQGVNFVKFLSNNLIEEEEILVNMFGKLNKIGVETNNDEYLMLIRKDCPESSEILIKHMAFTRKFEDLMKQTA